MNVEPVLILFGGQISLKVVFFFWLLHKGKNVSQHLFYNVELHHTFFVVVLSFSVEDVLELTGDFLKEIETDASNFGYLSVLSKRPSTMFREMITIQANNCCSPQGS